MTSSNANPEPQLAKPSNWNAPNIITGVRILLAPLFFWMLLADGGSDSALRWWAALLFIFAIGTDGIDGAIARRKNLVTDLGKLLDPIADKLLTSGALVCLSILGELPWWVTAIIVAREVGITVWRFVELHHGNVVPASKGGKLKTLVQSVAISLALLPFWVYLGEWVHWVNGIAMTAAVVITVYTGIQYFADAARLKKSSV